MNYKIKISGEAKKDLWFFKANERKIILSSIKEQLSHEPLTETKNRKELRSNPIASWELRSGKYRTFYEVQNDIVIVVVVSVGMKEHNKLYIRGEEIII